MDEWWVLLIQMKYTPSEIRKLTYPEMKLIMLARFEQAIEELYAQQEAKSPADKGVHTVSPDDPSRDAQLGAFAQAFKSSKGLNTG